MKRGRDMKSYTICIIFDQEDLDCIGQLTGIDVPSDAFDRQQKQLQESKESDRKVVFIDQRNFKLEVMLERYDSYLFTTITGVGKTYGDVADYLYSQYKQQGGNLQAQNKPN